jgi:hypothetical protein
MAAKPAKKFHIFHERHVREAAGMSEGCSAAENSMIAASYLEQ